MNCNEIRRLIPSVFRGETSLTEWALVEAHLKRCTGCEAERQRVEEEASRLTPTWLRGLADSATGLAERVPRTTAGLTRQSTTAARAWATARAGAARRAALTLIACRAALRAWISTAPGRAHGRLREAVSIAHASARDHAREVIGRGHARVGRVRTALSARLALVRARARRARASATATLVSVSQIKPIQIAGIALVVGVALYVLLPTPILRPDGGSEVAIAHHAPPRPEAAGAAARRGSDPAPPRLAATRSGAIAATTSAQSSRHAGPHVVGRLTVKDRGSSEQEVTALLARSGGARVGGRHEPATTIVDAVIPSSGYRKFVRGLAEIGVWKVEAERAPLPRGVRMTIRMDD